jgi:hypothetical protein
MPVEELVRIESLPRDWPALARLRTALWLNAAAPGLGLILLQRLRVGLTLALGFFLLAETALLAVLVMPLPLGGWATAASCLAATCWIASQALLLRRMGHLQDPHLRLYASSRIELARQAVADGQWVQAAKMLTEAAHYDDEQPELNWLLARVCTAIGPHSRARRQWQRLDQVDRRGRYEGEIRQALSVKAREASAQPG